MNSPRGLVSPSRAGGRGLRRLPAVYLAGFLLAAAAAPHRHINALADLLSDGPSGSGVIAEVRGTFDPLRGAQMNAVRLLEDEPCLACFSHDFAATGAWLDHRETLEPLGRTRRPAEPALPGPIEKLPASRSPPPPF